MLRAARTESARHRARQPPDGTLRAVIDGRYALADAAEAHRRMEAGLNVGEILLLPGMAGRSQPLAC